MRRTIRIRPGGWPDKAMSKSAAVPSSFAWACHARRLPALEPCLGEALDRHYSNGHSQAYHPTLETRSSHGAMQEPPELTALCTHVRGLSNICWHSHRRWTAENATLNAGEAILSTCNLIPSYSNPSKLKGTLRAEV